MINEHKIECYSLMKNDGNFTIDYLKSDYKIEHMEDNSSVSELRDSIPSPDEVLLPSWLVTFPNRLLIKVNTRIQSNLEFFSTYDNKLKKIK